MRSWKGAFAALFVCSWAGNQFSPLLLMYKEVDGYSTVVVNAFLGVYVLGLIPSLLVAGALSDRYGRRPIMLAGAICALAASGVLMLGETGAVPIYIGRLLSGVTVGTAMAVGTTWLKELSQGPYDEVADAGSGARRASLAFALGSGVGALMAGALAQWGPSPQVVPFLAHILVAVPMLMIVPRIPETRRDRDPSVLLRHQVRVPAASHLRFRLVVLIAAPWIFAVAALSYGYVPVLLQDQVQPYGVAYASLLTVLALGVAAVAQPLAKRLDSVDSARGLTFALVTLTASVASVGVVALVGSPVLGVAVAVLSGVGIGVGLSSGLLEVQRIARTRYLAGLTGMFYAAAYVGFLLPTAMAAITPPFTTAQLIAALVVLGGISTAVVAVHSRKHLPTNDPEGAPYRVPAASTTAA